MPHSRRNDVRAVAFWIAVIGGVAVGAGSACSGGQTDFHESDEVKGKACITCHAAAFNAATNPQHAGVLPETCQDCHTTQAWTPSKAADHPWWPIANKHVGVACGDCHTKGYRPGDTATDCYSCHKKDYDEAKDPKHDGYPTKCEQCHSDSGFKPSTYKHKWPLDGKHAQVACQKCHTSGKFDSTPKDCKSCHKKDYDDAKKPAHAGLPTTCESCHAPTGWQDIDYAHETWKLVGRHVITTCLKCHTGATPTWKGTKTDCYACHAKDNDVTAPQKQPTHTTFPHTCLDCHLMSGWVQGPPLSGLHPEAKFPLVNASPPQYDPSMPSKHSDPRITCQSCHDLAKGISAGGSNTDCTHCHTGNHQKAEMDKVHLQRPDGGAVPDYPQATSATNFCLKCHPLGQK